MGFVRADDHAPVEMAPGVKRKLICHGERAMAVRIELAKGSSVPDHSHVHEQIGFLASGMVRFTVGGETRLLQPGDGYSIPSNTPHAVEALQDSVAIDIFSPVRTEYL